jgi:hypothetical protein
MPMPLSIEENALDPLPRPAEHIVTPKRDDTTLRPRPLDIIVSNGSLILRDGDVDYAIVGAGPRLVSWS